jgi:hypothetical protein
MEQRFEGFIKYGSKVAREDDEDITIYSKVEVIKDIAPPKGPKAGEKYLKVEFHKLPGDAVFFLKSGSYRVVAFPSRANKEPIFTGEFSSGPEHT